MSIKTYLLETRPQFLILSVVLSFLGTAIAWYDGFFHLGHALLGFVGLLLAHVSVNVLNDYHDYRSGIDLLARRTPFSGGSGILPAGLLRPGQVFWLGMGSFLVAVVIGVYFIIVTGWLLLPLLVVAALLILLYTPFILKQRWPEWSPGLGMGTLPVLGAYFIQVSEYTWPLLIAAIPSGILVHNLLFLNEFPDVEADMTANRKTLPITVGKDRSSVIYIVLTLITYLWVIGWVAAGIWSPLGMPVYTLLALLTLPFAIKAIRGARGYDDPARLVPAMMNNVIVVLLTQLLLGVGYILAAVF
jgi:1,4-dihydroxy-2-naphthoate octaprenyltransferase